MSILKVWKDVDGVLTTDPRLVSSAIPVKELTYHEVRSLPIEGFSSSGPLGTPQAPPPARVSRSNGFDVFSSFGCRLHNQATELAYFGATVLHPKSMTPADYSPGMAVRVKNAYNPTAPGTLIMKVIMQPFISSPAVAL